MRHALAAFFLTLAGQACAQENLVSGLSQDTIQITSSYAGADIVVFGAIERPSIPGPADIVVIVRGPEEDVRVRRKDRIAGIWINRNRVILRGVPSYYFAASTRPLANIAPAEILDQYLLGVDRIRPQAIMGRHDPEPFRRAMIRERARESLFVEAEGKVRYLSGTLFRVRVPLPASAPAGKYTVEVYLIRNGNVIDARSSTLSIDQTGLERQIFDFAARDPLAYGLSAVLMALFAGWLSAALFRRAE